MFSKGVLVFDGAIGTELYERGFYINRPFEELNISAPGDVVAVHKSNIDAGAQAITSNTFSITAPQLRKFDIEAMQSDLLRAGLRVANEARKSKPEVRVGLSIGPMGVLLEPLGPTSREEVSTEFATVARKAVDSREPFDFYNLETFTNVTELESAIQGIRSVDQKTPILACLSIKSSQASILADFAERVGKRTDVEALGLNCSEGPSDILSQLQILHPLTEKPIVVQPNAGIPRQINGRYFYMTSPDYLAKYAKRYVEAGASAVGGCCGTGAAHIRAISGAIKMMNAKRDSRPQQIKIQSQIEKQASRRSWEERPESRVGQALRSGCKLISIELTSPKGTDLAPFFKQLDLVEAAGIEFVNVPDGARASTRVSSLHLASAVLNRRRGKVSVIPHFTSRDRNLIALQADLLGAAINGISDVLLVTGDPPKLGNNKEATGVYDIDSIGMTFLADCLNRGVSPTGDVIGSRSSFGIGVASNPTAANLELELQRWKFKCEMGADFAVTQPIYDPDSFHRWLDLVGANSRPSLVGIWPFVSLRNAEFMANEVPGVSVPQWAIDEMAKAGDDKLEAAKRGVEIARRVMEKLSPSVAGFCISAPLGRVEVALEVIK